MRIFAAAIILVGTVTATFLENGEYTVLADNHKKIDYNSTLGCAACIRGGYGYCLDNSDNKYGRGSNDICCDSIDCAYNAKTANNHLKCATSNPAMSTIKQEYFNDTYVAIQQFCKKRQDNEVCCGNKGNNDCKLDIGYKNKKNTEVDLNKLPWGGSCTYKISGKCGLPAITVNGSNIDVLISYKKGWFNQTDSTDVGQNETYSADEIYNPEMSNGEITFKLPKDLKEDKNATNETGADCVNTNLYMILTNLNNPDANKTNSTPALMAEARILQTVTENKAVITYEAVDPDHGMILSFTALFSAVLMLAAFAF